MIPIYTQKLSLNSQTISLSILDAMYTNAVITKTVTNFTYKIKDYACKELNFIVKTLQ